MTMQIQITFDNSSTQCQEINETLTWVSIKPPVGTRQGTISLAIPLRDIQAYWHPQCIDTLSSFIRWRFDFTCGAQYCAPLLIFFNRAGVNRALIATDNLIDDTQFACAMNQEAGTYDLTLTFTSANEFKLLLDFTQEAWQKRITVWRNSLHLEPPHIPASAWNPVYCTWYAKHGAVTEKWVEETVELAVPLGLRTLIIDDGWCYDQMKRVSPKTIADWYSQIGEWEVSKSKFPDFREHVKRVQAKGMKYMLWVAPHMIGDGSQFAQTHREVIKGDSHEGYRCLDVAF